MVQRIVSGGQTGVDRAALDAALELGLERGGWCPRGRKAEDGPLASRYPLTETPSEDYAQRTEWNVRDTDGTLILIHGEVEGGTAQTVDVAVRLSKPYLVVDLAQGRPPRPVRDWLQAQGIRTLNVAGPRESKQPGVYAQAKAFLRQVLVVRRSQDSSDGHTRTC